MGFCRYVGTYVLGLNRAMEEGVAELTIYHLWHGKARRACASYKSLQIICFRVFCNTLTCQVDLEMAYMMHLVVHP